MEEGGKGRFGSGASGTAGGTGLRRTGGAPRWRSRLVGEFG
jgi:hypothetical protein